MTYWFRATTYALVGGQHLYPGQALAYDGSRQHDAIIAELQAGRPVPVELLEAEHNPSRPPPPDEPVFSYKNTLGDVGEPVYSLDGTLTGHRKPGTGGLTGEALRQEMIRRGLRDDLRPPSWLQQPNESERGAEAPTAAEAAAYERKVAAMKAAYEAARLPAPPVGAGGGEQ